MRVGGGWNLLRVTSVGGLWYERWCTVEFCCWMFSVDPQYKPDGEAPCCVGDRMCGRVTFEIRDVPSSNKMCMVCVTAVHLWCHT
jgi:hypothetical protein